MTRDIIQRVRSAALYEPLDYFRRLTKPEIFPDPDVPLEIDLGCGDGGFLVALAAAHPDRHFLGIERLLGRARKAIRKAAWRGLDNVRVLRLEASYAVSHLLPVASTSRLHILFPDPWPKARHQRHRLVQPAFCAAVHRVLQPGGEWRFKTDHFEYFAEVLQTVQRSNGFEQAEWIEGTPAYPPTDFESQWVRAGRAIYQARFLRIEG